MARQVQEINAGSMADIAFLLLIFFLVTTTMDVDTGLIRKLPPIAPADQPKDNMEVNERNVFVVLVNSNDQLLVEGKVGNIATLRQEAKEFIANPRNASNLSDKKLLSAFLAEEQSAGKMDKVEDYKNYIDLVGDYPTSKGVISLQNDRGTSYGMYIQVQNELAMAVNELRNDLCQSKFGITYNKLLSTGDSLKIDAIKEAIPMQISEAEPKNVGGQ